MENTLVFPQPHHHKTKDLSAAIYFTHFIKSSYQKQIIIHTKRQKAQFEEAAQAPEPNMAGIQELLDRNLKQL